MFTISQSNPVEVLLAIAFVVIAVLALLGTFAFAVAYVFSNVKERWREYPTKKKLKVISNFVVTVAVISTLIVLSTTKLR
jgi:hypothetical protein